jgi:hypothetical protein
MRPSPSRAPRVPAPRLRRVPSRVPGAGSPPRAPLCCTSRSARPRSTAPGWLAHAAPSGPALPGAARTPKPSRRFIKPSLAVPKAVLSGPAGPAPRGPGMWYAAARSTVDNFTGDVDGETAGSFFRTQAVDGVSAGSKGCGCQSLCRVPIRILSLHTAQSACLHRVSTGLCTPGLDAVGRSAQDCPSHLLQLSWLRVRATGVGWSAGGGGGR